MTADLEQGRILQGRFVLERALLADASSSQLWLAHDRHLDAPLLLRIHSGATDDLGDRLARDAKRHRRLHHPHLARICDVHLEDDLLFVSIAPHDGQLLSTLLAAGGPMPYRSVVERVRPLVDGLVHLHENGGEHGRIDADHVLVDDEARWILLPGDETKPGRRDMTQLGRLVATLLTGGDEPDAARPLNDLPDRLHGGRTVPALLDQLVADLRVDDASLRPAGMRDVLTRLDQLEDVLASEPAPREAPPSPAPPEGASPPITSEIRLPPPAPRPARPDTPTPSRERRRPVFTAPWLAVLVVVAVLGGGLVLYATGVLDRNRGEDAARQGPVEGTPDAGRSVAEIDRTTTPSAAEAEAEAEAAAMAAARSDADEALSGYLAARQRADQIGAEAWAGRPYEEAAAAAGVADAAYLEQQYGEAAGGYRTAADGFEGVVASKDEALARLLAAGAEAIETIDARRATEAFRNALLIDPGHDEATVGLQRASTLEELDRMLTAGLAHETEGRLALAHAEYAAAAELDPRSAEAAAAYARIKTKLADEQFRNMMARGLEAFHRGDYDDARTHLLEAQRFRPEAVEVAEALAMVDEARVRHRVSELRARAEADEARERWQDARSAYQEVLAIDASVQFAQDGKSRCEAMITLERRTRQYLDDPDLLIRDGSREDAVRLVEELERLERRGPRLQRMFEELAGHVRLANTPLRVMLRSDEKTEVDVYRVGRYGTFDALELTLLPGIYTVVGHRKGYKDVRLTLHLKPGAEGTSLTVRCTEPI